MKAATDETEYPPIGDYAAIGDCRTVALVSRQGSIDWLCLPYFSAPAVFAALLDRRRGGRFALRPAAPFAVTRRYLDASNVLETTFETESGRVRLSDCMPILVGSALEHTLQPQREVLRIVEGLEGEVELEIVFAPRPDYARAQGALARRGALGWACACRDELLVLHSDLALHADDGTARGRVRLRAGEKRYLSLGYTRRDVAAVAPLGVEAEARLEATLDWWRAWSDRCRYEGPYKKDVLRSALTLKLLTYALSGAVVAAATTSLPEHPGGVRNWDYRFCWLRDASLTLRAFIDLGCRAEARAFIDWLLHATRLSQPELRVLYDVYGETHLPECELDHLEGYKGSRPVRIGNDAKNQLQLDAYGAVLLAVCDYVQRGGRLDRVQARVLAGFGRTVCRRWREPDEGIWEVRHGHRHYTHSKLMCWLTLHCLIRLHDDGWLRIPRERFVSERTAIAEVIESRGFNRSLDSYVRVFDGEEPDAALLLLERYGYKVPADPRMLGTYRYVQRELGRNGLLYRYRTGADGLPPGEGAFGLACFWAVDYLARLGFIEEATERFEQLLSYANDVGLFAEEIDPQTGAALGNFPQAFTHVGLITAALSVHEAQGHAGSADR